MRFKWESMCTHSSRVGSTSSHICALAHWPTLLFHLVLSHWRHSVQMTSVFLLCEEASLMEESLQERPLVQSPAVALSVQLMSNPSGGKWMWELWSQCMLQLKLFRWTQQYLCYTEARAKFPFSLSLMMMYCNVKFAIPPHMHTTRMPWRQLWRAVWGILRRKRSLWLCVRTLYCRCVQLGVMPHGRIYSPKHVTSL